jgi:hypothetical protein
MVDKRIEHDFKLMSAVAIVGVLAMFFFISTGDLGNASPTGYAISEVFGAKPSCNDSDNGLDYSIKGHLSGNLPRGFNLEDSCRWGFFLREVYCKGDQAASRITYCSHGCSNGFCKRERTPSRCGDGILNGIEQCDSNDFKDKTCNTLGFIGGSLGCTKTCVLNASGCTKPVCGNGVKEIHESCDGTDLDGKTCKSFNFASGMLKCYQNCKFNITGCVKTCSSDLECGERVCAGAKVHETCENGRCVFKMNCSETKCAKEGEYTSGTVAPQYQYGCCVGLVSFNPHPAGWVGGGDLCYNPEKGTPECRKQGNVEGWYYPKTGQLLKADTCMKNISIQTSCTDSDGGINYNVKGSCYDSTQKKTYVDYCDEEAGGTKKGGLEEAGCQYVAPGGGSPEIAGNTVCVYNSYTCPNGCKDGACIKEPVITSGCTDSDGGKNYAVKGTIKNSYGISATDGCGARISTLCGDGISPIGDNECLKKALVEYYCGGDSVSSPIKVGDIIKLDNMDCNYIGYAMDGYVSIGCGTSGIQRAPMGADGGFTITQPWTNNQFKFYVINIGTANSNIRAAEPLLMFENIKCPYTCSEGACVEQPINITFCGDGMISPGEECDGANLGGMTCARFEFDGGILGCTASCKLDTTRCTRGMRCSIDSDCPQPATIPEYMECNGKSLCRVTGGYTCLNNICVENKKYYDCLNCTGGCANGACVTGIRVSATLDGVEWKGPVTYDISPYAIFNETIATGTQVPAQFDIPSDVSLAWVRYRQVGGTGFPTGPEGSYLAGISGSCAIGGTPLTYCPLPASFVLQFKTRTGCGDWVLQPGEQCDGRSSMTKCADFGFANGSVFCYALDCTYTTRSCVGTSGGYCGDGRVEVNEQCDSSTGSMTCLDFGFAGGLLTCNANCKYDTSRCFNRPECTTSSDCKVTSCKELSCVPVNQANLSCVPFSREKLAASCTCENSKCIGNRKPAGYCGDGIIQQPNSLGFNESCDTTSLNGKRCTNFFNSTGGILRCHGDCSFDFSDCYGAPVYCGNGIIDAGEQCDGAALGDFGICPPGSVGGATSISNPVRCRGDCTLDYSGCSSPLAYCGDGVVNQNAEECDGSDLTGETCLSLGYVGGSLSCTPNCKFDRTTCIEVPPRVCGDGIVQRPNSAGFNEDCDGNNLVARGCTDLGNFVGGNLTCNADCTFNYISCIISNPPRCGDGKINADGEECDGTNFDGASCVSLGYDGGDLVCDNNCHIDKSHCITAIVTQPVCGDNVINTDNEICDGTELGGRTCQTQGYVSGTLKCTGSCALDPRECSMCNNNGVCQPRMTETAENCPGDCIVSPIGVALFTNPGITDIAVGDTVTLDISVSSVTDLYGYQFDVEYDPSVLEYISLTDGAFLTDTSTQPFCMAPDATSGILNNIACTKTGDVGGVSGSGLLKRITFKALAIGTSNVVISNAKLVNSAPETISAQVLSGQISVS